MAGKAILLSSALFLISFGLSSSKPLDEEVLIERYFRSLRQASTDPGPLENVEDKEDEEEDPSVNESFWMDSDYMDEDNETPAISLSFLDLGGLKPSVNAVKRLGKTAEQAMQKTAREGKVFAEDQSSLGGADSEFENKIPLQWAGMTGLFKQLKSS